MNILHKQIQDETILHLSSDSYSNGIMILWLFLMHIKKTYHNMDIDEIRLIF